MRVFTSLTVHVEWVHWQEVKRSVIFKPFSNKTLSACLDTQTKIISPMSTFEEREVFYFKLFLKISNQKH